ncbi:hypothetical protein E2C01_030124 [Portunus trituberculatus]|uniref:Uncharacterized protein n=1 Tax=Portunus trituberculatus TaxID=210409 RepID=A0A5B7ETX1_PORTR|nr:hypothetical protein [Portunus trituberculatus]
MMLSERENHNRGEDQGQGRIESEVPEVSEDKAPENRSNKGKDDNEEKVWMEETLKITGYLRQNM